MTSSPLEGRRALAVRFRRLALYNVAAGATVPLAGFVDTALLGHLDDARFLAGVALGAVIFDYLYWSFGFLRMATTGLTAQARGRRDREESDRILARGLIAALLAGLAVLAAGPWLAAAGFGLLSGPGEVEAAGAAYVTGRILGAPATLASYVLVGFLLGSERPRAVLLLTLVAQLTNIALDLVFLRVLGWNAWGAGLATAASQWVQCGVGLSLTAPHWRAALARPSRLLARGELTRSLRFQGALTVRTFLLISAFALFANVGAVLGTLPLAANALLQRWQSAAALVVDGLAFALEALAGLLYSGGRRDDLRWLVRRAHRVALALGLAFAACIALWPGLFLGLLTDQTETLALARAHRLWLVPVLVFGAGAYVFDGLFIGLTAGRELIRSVAVAWLAGFGPLAVAAWWWRDLDLLWAAMAAFLALRAAVLYVLWRRLEGRRRPRA